MIELGEVSSAPGSEDRPAPEFTRRSISRAALAVIAVLTVLTVTGSAVPEPHGLRQLWSVPLREEDGLTLAADSALVSRSDGDRTTITSYELATGAVRWSRELPGGIGWVQPVGDGGILLLPVNRDVVELEEGSPDAIATEFHRETIALEAGTGDVLWRTAGEPHSTGRDTALLAEHTDQGRINRLRLVRSADGAEVWVKNTSALENQAVALRGREPYRLVTATRTGEITVFRYADGAQLARAKVPWIVARPEEGFFNDLNAGDGFLVVNQSRRETVDQFVYRLDTLAELWRARDTNGYGFVCGAARLCLNEGSRVVAHDAETGERRWDVDGTGNLFPVSDTRLLADTGMDDGSPTLVDAETGRVLGEGARGSTVWTSQAVDHVLLMRYTTNPIGRSTVTRWNLEDGSRRLLGAIEAQTAQRCQAVPGYLACYRDDRLEIIGLG